MMAANYSIFYLNDLYENPPRPIGQISIEQWPAF